MKLSGLSIIVSIVFSVSSFAETNKGSQIHHLFWKEQDYSEVCTSFLVNISDTDQPTIKLATNYHCLLHQHENIGQFSVSLGASVMAFQNRPHSYTMIDKVNFFDYERFKWNDLMVADVKQDWLKNSEVFKIAGQAPVKNDFLTLTGFSKEYGGPIELHCRYEGKMISYPSYLETQSRCHTNTAPSFLSSPSTTCPDPHQMNPTEGKTISEVMLCEPKKIRESTPSEMKLNINFIGIKNPDSLGGMSGGPIQNKNGEIVGINSSTLGAININGNDKIIILYRPLNKKLFNNFAAKSGKIFLDNVVAIINGRIAFGAQAEACMNSENLILGNYHLKSDLFEKYFDSTTIELDQNDKIQKFEKLDCD